MRSSLRGATLVVVAMLFVACGGPAGSGATTSVAPSAAGASADATDPLVTIASAAGETPIPSDVAVPSESAVASESAAVSEAPEPSASTEASPSGAAAVDPAECASQAQLLTPGTLTIGTDNPAFPPWFDGGAPEGSDWEINDPATGEGFESAVAYAVANAMGFTVEQVTWVPVKFDRAYAPGDKPFDFDINQVSFTPERAQAVDFSDSYYDVNQALVALEGTDIASATSVAELKGYRLGAQIGTTSYDYIVENIAPDQEPSVYDSNDAAIAALEAGSDLDGIVVDLPSAFFITAVQLEDGVIVGQFPTVGEQEHFGMVLPKGSALTDCVNAALAQLRDSGELEAIQQEWLADKADAPILP